MYPHDDLNLRYCRTLVLVPVPIERYWPLFWGKKDRGDVHYTLFQSCQTHNKIIMPNFFTKHRAGHPRQLLWQSDTILRPTNWVSPVTFPLIIMTKLHYDIKRQTFFILSHFSEALIQCCGSETIRIRIQLWIFPVPDPDPTYII